MKNRKLTRDQLWILRHLAEHGTDYSFAMSKEHGAPCRTAIDYNLNHGLADRGYIRTDTRLVTYPKSATWVKWVEITEDGRTALMQEESQ